MTDGSELKWPARWNAIEVAEPKLAGVLEATMALYRSLTTGLASSKRAQSSSCVSGGLEPNALTRSICNADRDRTLNGCRPLSYHCR